MDYARDVTNECTLTDFKEDFNMSYMTSSTVFISTSVGCDRSLRLWSIHWFFTVRFTLGLLLFEHVTKFLNRLPVNPKHWFSRRTENITTGLGESAIRGRYLSLIIFSVVHASFFIIMGVCRSYTYIMVSYITAAFTRAFLTGKLGLSHLRLQFSNTLSPTGHA